MTHIKLLLSALIILICTTQCTSTTETTGVIDAQSSTNRILFISAVEGAGWELFSINPDGTDLKQLTSLSNLIGNFQWSPDGQQIAFTTFPPGFSLNLVLNVMNADGSELHQLSDNTNGGLEWSPDSQQIAFTTKRDGLIEIYTINKDGSDERRLTYGTSDRFMNDVYTFSWSPDGKQIVFIRAYALYIVHMNGTKERELLTNYDSKTSVAWSPDGKTIALVMTDGDYSAIYIMFPDGSNVQSILDIPSSYTSLIWSPDSQHLLYTQKNSGVVSRFVVDADGKNNHQLADSTTGASWSPDSKQIVYGDIGSPPHLESALYIIDLNGENPRKLEGHNTFDHSPLWFVGD